MAHQTEMQFPALNNLRISLTAEGMFQVPRRNGEAGHEMTVGVVFLRDRLTLELAIMRR